MGSYLCLFMQMTIASIYFLKVMEVKFLKKNIQSMQMLLSCKIYERTERKAEEKTVRIMLSPFLPSFLPSFLPLSMVGCPIFMGISYIHGGEAMGCNGTSLAFSTFYQLHTLMMLQSLSYSFFICRWGNIISNPVLAICCTK